VGKLLTNMCLCHQAV